MPDDTIRQYLGDGVYAEFRGWDIAIHADRDGQRHTIYLEGPTLLALFKFAKQCGWDGDET
jgi:hypothetical protein